MSVKSCWISIISPPTGALNRDPSHLNQGGSTYIKVLVVAAESLTLDVLYVSEHK